jgi:hypothetical protein
VIPFEVENEACDTPFAQIPIRTRKIEKTPGAQALGVFRQFLCRPVPLPTRSAPPSRIGIYDRPVNFTDAWMRREAEFKKVQAEAKVKQDPGDVQKTRE